MRDLVLRHLQRAGGEAVESVELRLAYGKQAPSAAQGLVSDGLAERVALGVYRARRVM